MSKVHGTLQALDVKEPTPALANSTHSHIETIGPRSQRHKTEHDSSPTDSNQLSKWIGRHLDRYKIVRKLGGGGMGEVYLARHRWLDIPVAIKVLQPMLGGNEQAIDRFRREARMVAGLNHANIVRAIDGGPIENSYFLATEYLDGLDLNNLVTNNGPFPPAYAAWIVLEVASALQYAHERSLVHRDIKPHNIMLLRNGSVKLLDLGLARNLDSKSKMTATGQFMGTVDFVSPEQALDTRGVDLRTDFYSLGCTLYYLVTGRVPFGGSAYDSIASKILAHTEETPVPATDYCPSIPTPLLAAIDRLMEKSPEDRFQTAAEVFEALAPIANPSDGHRKLTASNRSRHAPSAAKASSGESELDKIADVVFQVLWVVFRTILSVCGIMERTEVSSNSRLGGKTQYKWEVSAKGLATFIAVALFMLWFFTCVVIVEF